MGTRLESEVLEWCQAKGQTLRVIRGIRTHGTIPLARAVLASMKERENEVEEVPATMREAARGFAELVARVHYQGVRVVLKKNGKPWAWIVQIPPGAQGPRPPKKKKKSKSR